MSIFSVTIMRKFDLVVAAPDSDAAQRHAEQLLEANQLGDDDWDTFITVEQSIIPEVTS